jgi:hypothetical protein
LRILFQLAFFVAQVMQSNKAKAVLGSIFSTNGATHCPTNFVRFN